MTAPLKQFDAFAASMGRNEFHPLEIHTNDELERAAANLNAMGNQITAYQKSLQNKNEQMEQLLDNVAHDLKTPVSLIRLYADGIKDGLDDGTFLDTIMQQSSQMDRMINRLLFLTRIEKKEPSLEPYDLSDCCGYPGILHAAFERAESGICPGYPSADCGDNKRRVDGICFFQPDHKRRKIRFRS